MFLFYLLFCHSNMQLLLSQLYKEHPQNIDHTLIYMC